MSYYKKITDYTLTHHSMRRIRERLEFKNAPDYIIYQNIEEMIKDGIVDFFFPNGDKKIINYQHNVQFIITNNNVIKTVINLNLRSR